jgi:PAS domain-containing protein
MQVDTPQPTVFSVSCVRSEIGSNVLVLGLMRNCEKDMRNEMYLVGVRDLLSDFCASSPSAVLLLGNDGAIRDMNDHFKELFEVDKENTLIGFDVRFEERRLGHTLVRKLTDALTTKEQFQGRAGFALASGTTIDLNYRVFNFQFRDKYGGIAFAADLVPEPAKASPDLILDSTLVPVVIIDRWSRVITFANDAAKTQLGIDPERVGTEKLSDRLLKTKDIARLENSLSMRGCEPGFDIETAVNFKTGVRFQVRANLDQSDPKARAVLEFLPAREEQGFVARIKAALTN